MPLPIVPAPTTPKISAMIILFGVPRLGGSLNISIPAEGDTPNEIPLFQAVGDVHQWFGPGQRALEFTRFCAARLAAIKAYAACAAEKLNRINPERGSNRNVDERDDRYRNAQWPDPRLSFAESNSHEQR